MSKPLRAAVLLTFLAAGAAAGCRGDAAPTAATPRTGAPRYDGGTPPPPPDTTTPPAGSGSTSGNGSGGGGTIGSGTR